MKKYLRTILILAVGAGLFGVLNVQADSFTFATLPASGDVAGLAGSTVSWGYSITNQSSTDWLLTTDISTDPLFVSGVPLSEFDFPIVAPGATVSGDLYGLLWDVSAPVGTIESGTFVLSAEWRDGDPFAGGAFLSIDSQTAAYSATVSGAAAVAEPSALLLLAITGFGLGAMWWLGRYWPGTA